MLKFILVTIFSISSISMAHIRIAKLACLKSGDKTASIIIDNLLFQGTIPRVGDGMTNYVISGQFLNYEMENGRWSALPLTKGILWGSEFRFLVNEKYSIIFPAIQKNGEAAPDFSSAKVILKDKPTGNLFDTTPAAERVIADCRRSTR